MLLVPTLSIYKYWNYSAAEFSCEFCKSFKSTYLVKHFERLLLDWHKLTIENYYPLSETSVFFWIRNHIRCLVWELGISFKRKVNACKEKVWNFTKSNFVRRYFSKTYRKTVIFRTHILMSCISNNKFGYIDMKTIYGGEPKERNVETGWMIFKHTEKVDSIRKDKVETRLKWKWNVWY